MNEPDLMKAFLDAYEEQVLARKMDLMSDIVAAFMARYRLDPADCVLVHHTGPDGDRIWVEKKGPYDRANEGAMSPMPGEW